MDIGKSKSDFKKIAEKYGINMLVLFGSQATGRTHPKSDIDIGYTASREIELNIRFEIEIEISRMLGKKDIEFVDLQRISPVMKKIIADEGIVLYERVQGIFESFCMYAFKLYIETKPLRESRYQSLRNFAYGTSR